MLCTSDYQRVLHAMHTQGDPWGTKGRHYIRHFIDWFHALGCVDILDYGAGHASIRKAFAELQSSISVHCYDPGIPELAALPDPADFVVCTDVLEHIEPALIDNVLNHMHGLTKRGGFFSIALLPAKRDLPDGRNAHILLKPTTWWRGQIGKRWSIAREQAGTKHYQVWVKK